MSPKSRFLTLVALRVATLSIAAPPERGAGGLRKPANAGPRETIIFRGSTTWEPINNLVPARFAAVEPKIELDIEIPPLGSAGGIRALIEGNCLELGVGLTDSNADGRIDCDVDNNGAVEVPASTTPGEPGLVPDIAQSSRAATATEKAAAANSGLVLVGVQAARDGLGLIVHASNPVAQLSKAQVFNMYMNDAGADWGLYGGNCPDPARTIHLYTRNTDGGTYGSFIDFWIGVANEPTFRARAATRMTIVDTALEGVAAVAADPCGMFYAGIGDFSAEPLVKAVPAYNTIPPGVLPTFDTVTGGQYPFSRPMFTYTIGVPGLNDPRGRFIDWLATRSGQAVIAEGGFVPGYNIDPLVLVRDSVLAEYPAP